MAINTVPAVFIIGGDNIVLFAGSEGGDYKKRVDPQEVVAALKKYDTGELALIAGWRHGN